MQMAAKPTDMTTSSERVSAMTGLHAASRPSTRWRAWQALRRNRLALVGSAVILVAIIAAVGATAIAPYDPVQIGARARLLGPRGSHLMGTDNLGRDTFSRVLFGARTSLMIAGLSIGVAGGIGVFLGLVSGYFGRWVDEVIMRLMDIFYAIPELLLALALVATFGTGINSLIVAIAIGRIPGFARITRGAVLAVRSNEYVTAARTVGLRADQIIRRYILPNVLAPITVIASISFALAILIEASLSFLGLGIQPPTPSLGGLLNEAQSYMNDAPWMAIFPGVTIAVIVFAFNVLGDGLRDALDPSLK